jgi:hypothetical protein
VKTTLPWIRQVGESASPRRDVEAEMGLGPQKIKLDRHRLSIVIAGLDPATHRNPQNQVSGTVFE